MIARSAGEVLEKHVTLDIEGIDRLYLNAYQPLLQTPGGVVNFFKRQRGAQVASTVLMAPMTRAFVRSVERFSREHGIETVRFARHQRKDEETLARLRHFEAGQQPATGTRAFPRKACPREGGDLTGFRIRKCSNV